jgi:hypothetical protein
VFAGVGLIVIVGVGFIVIVGVGFVVIVGRESAFIDLVFHKTVGVAEFGYFFGQGTAIITLPIVTFSL